MSCCSQNFGKNKIVILPFLEELGLISLFEPISQKSKNQHKFSPLNFLMLNKTILEIPYCQLNFDKNKLEILPFFFEGGSGRGGLELTSI